MLIVDAFARTDVGLERTHNEDAVLTSVSRKLFIVADGMGGAPCGEVASSIAVISAADALKSWPAGQRGEISIKSAFEAADQAVRDKASSDPDCFGMGTTLAILAMEDSVAWIGHVGDSRIYLMRDSKLHRLTKDHGAGHTLLRAIGLTRLNPDISSVEMMDGDVFMLCTDGLSKSVRSSQIELVLSVEATASCVRAVDILVQMALAAGGKDNVTVAVVRVAQ